eukprot:6925878-Ditylum_brightwellii.AAC.1
MDKSEIEEILKGTSKTLKLQKTTEVKVVILSFHSVDPDFSPYVIVAAHPQSNNQKSDFTKDMETAMSTVATRSPSVTFTNFEVDGVTLESDDVWRSICDFLFGIKNLLCTTSTNHNINSWQYQIIGESGAVNI